MAPPPPRKSALREAYDQGHLSSGKLDLNNTTRAGLSTKLQELDSENLVDSLSVSEFSLHYDEVANKILDYRNQHSGMIHDFAELDGHESHS